MEKEQHSVLGASSCHRWWHCPGSIALIAKAPEPEESKYAAEGALAHKVAAAYLLNEPIPECTDEMREAVQVYREFIGELVEQWEEKPLIEQLIKIPMTLSTAPGWALSHPTKLYGTADCIINVPYNRLYVIDYKHGKGVQVEAEDNLQLKYYGLGALFTLPKEDWEDVPVVEMIIVQPRGLGNPIKRFEMKTSDLLDWHKELIEHAKATELPDAQLCAGDHCKFCPAAVTCPCLRKQATAITTVAFEKDEQVHLPKPELLSTTFFMQVVEKADMIRDWLKEVESYALKWAQESKANAQLLNGFYGYQLQEKYGNRKWKDVKATEKLLAEEIGKDIYAPKEILSVAAMEKMLKKTKVDFDLKPYVERPFNGYALVKGKLIEGTVTGAFDGLD